ncbi:DUF234 domain-containing protein [Clostridium tagluense]|uniref:DUF234 domain-containing protein n=1 Tax=Clostridium tagluense TaxID=360422 RepID=UPI001C6F41DA|nr:DUF234 domain-containing protein [Clostridium tagluense]MBW9159416.1 DUF234 domain-containing protein [Clostridium tagluense]WLC66661.1 DUF234 domain-containing protein [Clostridium tagluense]
MSFPYNAYLEMDRYQCVLDVIQRNLIDNHTAFIFEKVCSELLWNMQLPFVPLKVGRWWDDNNEIDVAGINSFENCIIFGECKFWNKKIGMNILINLKEKAKQVKCLKKDRKEYFILFLKLGFNEDLIEAEKRGEVILYSLQRTSICLCKLFFLNDYLIDSAVFYLILKTISKTKSLLLI